MATNSPGPLCPTCGCPLLDDAPVGQCPRCLLDLIDGDVHGGGAGGETMGETLPFTPQPLAGSANGPFPLRSGNLHSAATPEEIEDFQLIEKVGEGGFGEVWKAEQIEPVRRIVALKLIKPGLDSREILDRFGVERRTLAKMEHPNIARLFDAGTTASGRPYVAMEWVDGLPLTTYCDRKCLSVRERVELFRDACRAVQHAHQKGVMHRDLKPSNVLVAEDEAGQPVVKVIDFGIAKALTGESADPGETLHTLGVLGTPAYMSPEQALGDPDIDMRTDVYSLGVMLYELLTGRPPLDPKALMRRAIDEILRAIREEEPKRPSAEVATGDEQTVSRVAAARATQPNRLPGQLRGDLDWIAIKALEKDRTRRYETPAALEGDLGRYLKGEPVEAAPPGAWYLATKFVRRHRVGVAAAAVVLAAMVAAVAVSARFALMAERERIAAETAAAQSEAVTNILITSLTPPPPSERSEPETAIQILDRAVRAIEAENSISESRKIAAIIPIVKSYTKHGASHKGLPHAENIYNFYRNRFGDTHPDTLSAMRDLALAHRAQGQFNESAELFEKIHKGYDTHFHPGHPKWNMSLLTLSETYLFRGQHSRVIDLNQHALKRMDDAKISDENRSIPINLIARALHLSGRFPEELVWREKYLAIKISQFGKDSEATLDAESNLAVCLFRMNRRIEAIRILKNNIERSTLLYGNSAKTIGHIEALARLQMDSGAVDESIELFKDAFERYNELMGAGHPNTLDRLNALGKAYQQGKQFDNSISSFKGVLSGRIAYLGERHPATVQSMFDLGSVYLADGRISDAESLMKSVASLARKEPGIPRLRLLLRDALSKLRDLYELAGREEELQAVSKELSELK